MSEENPYFRFNPAEFMADCDSCDLRVGEVSAYMSLLCLDCRDDGICPDLLADPVQIKSIFKMSPRRFRGAWTRIKPLFDLSVTGKWRSNRQDTARR